MLLSFYLKYVCEKENLNLPNGEVISIIQHIEKLDKFILFIIKFYLYFLNSLCFIFFWRGLSKLDAKRITRIKNVLFPFNFLINKIDQIFFVVSSMHIYADEKIIEKKHNQTPKKNYYRFIVIGSGPGGSVTANEIAKKYNGEVLIIEKGHSYGLPKIKHPGDEFSKKWYRGGINSTYFPEMIAYSSATCLGGGSEINSGLFHEPDEEFLSIWSEDFDTKDLTYDSLKPFSNIVKNLTSDTKGEVKFSDIFHAGEKDNPSNISDLRKFYNSETGLKNSMTQTILKEFEENKGEIESGTEVRKILKEHDRWKIKCHKDGMEKEFETDNLFICCGSIFTNNLLLKSGIANNKRKILRTFKFHPMVKVIGCYDEEIQELNEDVICSQNIKNYPENIIGNATSSFQFLISSFQKKIEIQRFIKDNWKRMKVFHVTFSLGKGHILSIPFFSEPFLLYFLSRKDKKIVVKGIKDLIKFIHRTNAKCAIPIDEKNPVKIHKNNLSKEISNIKNIKGYQISSVHILGGVTMGENKKCVVDSYGKVHELEGVYVNDSSLINTDLLKNPQGTVMTIALRNVTHFLEKI